MAPKCVGAKLTTGQGISVLLEKMMQRRRVETVIFPTAKPKRAKKVVRAAPLLLRTIGGSSLVPALQKLEQNFIRVKFPAIQNLAILATLDPPLILTGPDNNGILIGTAIGTDVVALGQMRTLLVSRTA